MSLQSGSLMMGLLWSNHIHTTVFLVGAVFSIFLSGMIRSFCEKCRILSQLWHDGMIAIPISHTLIFALMVTGERRRSMDWHILLRYLLQKHKNTTRYTEARLNTLS